MGLSDQAHTTDAVLAHLARGPSPAGGPPKVLGCPGGCCGAGWSWASTPAGDRRVACAACNPDAIPEASPLAVPAARKRDPKCPGRCRGSGEVWVRVPNVGDRKLPCPACRRDDAGPAARALAAELGQGAMASALRARPPGEAMVITPDDVGTIDASILGS